MLILHAWKKLGVVYMYTEYKNKSFESSGCVIWYLWYVKVGLSAKFGFWRNILRG